MGYLDALNYWSGKSDELKQWLIEHNLMSRSEKYYIRRAVSLWLANSNPEAATFAEGDMFKSLFNEKRLMREHERTRVQDNNFADFFKVMEIANSNLRDFHNTEITNDDLKSLKVDSFKQALYRDGLQGRRIAIKITAELPGGTEVEEVRDIKLENIEEIIRILNNMGVEMEEDLGYELGKITKSVEIKKVQILDLNQLPAHMRSGKRRTPGFFSWLVKPSPFDLRRYQMYENVEEVDTELCFIHALRMKGVDPTICNAISLDLKDIDTVTLRTVEHIADKYKLHINVKAVYPTKFYNNRYPRDDMYNENCDWIELCFFTLANTEYPEHIIPYDKSIMFNFNYFKVSDEQRLELNKLPLEKLMKFSKFNRNGARFDVSGEGIDSIRLLRELHERQSIVLTPLTTEQRIYLKNKDANCERNLFEITESCYRRWETKSKNINVIEDMFSKIDNLYQVSGNAEEIIRKCVSGLGPRISKKQHISEPILDLDLVSCHANAATHIKLPLGKPKRFSNDVDIDTVEAAYLLINITKINRRRKYSAVQYLKTGARWVDLITLKDLIKWHEIEYEIIDGIYFNDGSVSIADQIMDIFEQRKLPGMSSKIKSILNRDLYGKSMKHRKSQDKIWFECRDDAFMFFCKNSNAKLMKQTEKGQYYVLIGKRWTDSYNMIYLGCSILSMARSIINNYIYTLEDNGVEVLYSNMDSIFIRKRDMEKFNELFPNAIGNELGQFHYDFDFPNYEYAQEAIFLKRGIYILKLDDEHYQIRNLGGYFEKPTWNGYLQELNSIRS